MQLAMSTLLSIWFIGLGVLLSGGLFSLVTCPRFIKPYCYTESLNGLYFNEIALGLMFAGGAVLVLATIIRTIQTSGKTELQPE
jgi:hypothetical protein